MLLVPAHSPYKTLADLARDMKAPPGEVAYASAGNGSTTHLCTVLLHEMTHTHTQARHIPYKGAAGAVTDVVGGQVAFTCQSTSTAMALVRAGRLRPLAVTSPKRLEGLADVPTVSGAGVPGYESTSWIGVMVPASTPDAIVQRFSDDFMKVCGTPAFRTFCEAQSLAVDPADSKTFRADIPKDVERWRRIIEATKRS